MGRKGCWTQCNVSPESDFHYLRGCQPGKRTLLLLLLPRCLPVFWNIFWIFPIQSQYTSIIVFSTYIHCSLYLWGGGFSAPHLAPTCAPPLAPGVGGCPKPYRGSAIYTALEKTLCAVLGILEAFFVRNNTQPMWSWLYPVPLLLLLSCTRKVVFP